MYRNSRNTGCPEEILRCGDVVVEGSNCIDFNIHNQLLQKSLTTAKIEIARNINQISTPGAVHIRIRASHFWCSLRYYVFHNFKAYRQPLRR